MRFASRALFLTLTTLALCASASAQTLRSEGDPRNIAPTVGTGGPPGGPTGLFTIYDGQTLRKGEFTFSFAYSNYDRDPGNVDITEVPVSFQIGLSDRLELFFNTDAYRGVKVNSPQNLSSFYLPNSQLFIGGRLQSPAAIVLVPTNNVVPTVVGRLFRPVGNQPFVQFPFVGGSAGNFASGFAGLNQRFTFTLGTPSGNTGNFDAAGNFPGIGSVFGSILPGIVLTTRVQPATSTTQAITIPVTFTEAPSYLPDAPFVNRIYGESSFNTFTIGAKYRFTGPNNAFGVGLIPFYRFYADNADDASGFNQLQRGSSPGSSLGDFGLVFFADGRLTKHINISGNLGYILNSNPKSEALGDVVLLDRPDEVIAGIGFDFPVNNNFQPILELKSVQYVGGRTPNAFQNNPVDFLAGVRIFPRRFLGFSGAYRLHLNQQGDRLFNDADPSEFPAGFVQSEDPHGYLFQFFVGHRNERLPETLPNQPPTVTLAANPSRVTLPANCGAEQIPNPNCTPTSTQVQLSASASDPDGDTLLYTYTVTGGRIVGDGPNVTWDLAGVSPGTYTANIEVDDGCGCIAFTTTTVTVDACDCIAAPTPTPAPVEEAPMPTPTPPLPPTCTKVDEYGPIRRNDVKARLDNFAIELQNNPGATGYIIAYGGRRGPAGEAQQRADFAKNDLVTRRGIEEGRLVTIDGGFREEATTELYVCPSGAPPPMASPTVDASEVQIIRRRAPRRGTRRRRGRDDDE